MSAAAIVPGVDRVLSDRVSLAVGARQTLTMAYRALVKIRRTPEQLFDVTLQPIVFTLLFTYIFGGAISGDVHSYLPFFIPGILVQTVITTSLVTGVQLREDLDKGVSARFRTLPIARVAPLAGALLTDTLRYAIATILTVVMGIVLGWRPGGGVGGVVAAGSLVIATAWALSWIFAYLGVRSRTAAHVQGVSFLVLFPLTFLSNIFVPVDTLPGWLRVFASVNPVSQLVTAARDLSNTGTAGPELAWTLVGALVVVAVFAPLTLRAYVREG